jgi:ABC-2 type transport system ATP-binding protein
LMRHIGLCPEQDAFYEWMTGYEFILTCAKLAGMSGTNARAATETAIGLVGMSDHEHRPVRDYSKGMRQRMKLAQALLHEPQVLFLDEPFTGTDPVARHELLSIIRRLAGNGRGVVVSSHVLHEVEALTTKIILLHRGRLVAEGQVREIRELIDRHPHRILLVCDQYRMLAARLVCWEDVERVTILENQEAVLAETRQPDAFYARLPAISREDGMAIREVRSEDDNLDAVFKYLVER